MYKLPKVHTGKVGDFDIKPRSSKQITRSAFNLGMGYTFLPFIKIKSLSRSKK